MRQTNCAVVDVSTEGEGDAIYAQFVCILLRYLVRVNEEDARSEYVFFYFVCRARSESDCWKMPTFMRSSGISSCIVLKFEMLSVAKIAKYRNRHNRQNTIENVSRSTFRYPNKC